MDADVLIAVEHRLVDDPLFIGPIVEILESGPHTVVRPRSLEHLVALVQVHRRHHGRLRRLDLVGHGTPGRLSVGSGERVWVPSRYIDRMTAAALSELAECFEDGAVLQLLGCGTALCASNGGPGGPETMLELSLRLGVTVTGTAASIAPHHFTKEGFGSPELLVTVAHEEIACPLIRTPGQPNAMMIEAPLDLPSMLSDELQPEVRSAIVDFVSCYDLKGYDGSAYVDQVAWRWRVPLKNGDRLEMEARLEYWILAIKEKGMTRYCPLRQGAQLEAALLELPLLRDLSF